MASFSGNRAGGTINGSVQNATLSSLEYSPAGTEASAIMQYGSLNGILSVTGNSFINTEIYIALQVDRLTESMPAAILMMA